MKSSPHTFPGQPTPAPSQEGKRPTQTAANVSRFPLSEFRFSTRSGISLIECLVYIAVLGVMISVGGFTIAKAWDAHRALSRNANDIQRAVNAGERWRAEIRSAIQPVEIRSDRVRLRIPTTNGVIEYQFADGALQRRTGDQADWLPVLTRVRHSQMQPTTNTGLVAWRWELEMEPASKRARHRPLFTFTAVPPGVAR